MGTHGNPYWTIMPLFNPTTGKYILLFIIEKEEGDLLVDSVKKRAAREGWAFEELNCDRYFRTEGTAFLRGDVEEADVNGKSAYRRRAQSWWRGTGVYYFDQLDRIIDNFEDSQFDSFFRSLYSLRLDPEDDSYPIKNAVIWALLDEQTCLAMLARFKKLRIVNPFKMIKQRIRFLRAEERCDVYVNVDTGEEIKAKSLPRGNS